MFRYLYLIIFILILSGCNDTDSKQPLIKKNNIKPIQEAQQIPSIWRQESDAEFPSVDFKTTQTASQKNTPSKEQQEREEKARKLYEKLREKVNIPGSEDIRDTLAQKYHDTPAAIEAALYYAQEKARLDKMDGVKAYEWILEKWPGSNRRWDAVYQIQNLLNMYFSVYNYSQYHNLDSSKLNFNISGRNIQSVDVKIYQVDLLKMVEEGVNPQIPSIPVHAKEVKSWQEKIEQKQDHWFSQQLKLPQLPAGYYILSTGTKYLTINSLFSTSPVAMVTKYDGSKLLCWGKDLTTNDHVGTCRVIVLKNGKLIYQGTTNEEGLFVANIQSLNSDSGNFAVIMDSKRGQSASGSYYYWYNSYYQRINYSFTDRPVYRPGQTVNYKGIFRSLVGEQESMEVKRENPIQVTIYDNRWQKIQETKLELNEYGSVHGSYQIPDTAKLGHYYIYFSGGDSYYHQSHFEVEEYKKPEYEVTVQSSKASFIQGEEITMAANAMYYFGEPVKEAEVEYEVFEAPRYYYSYYYYEDEWGWFGEGIYRDHYYPQANESLIHQGKGKLDESGNVQISFQSRENKDYDLQYRVRVSVIDKSRRKISGFAKVLATRSEFRLSVVTPQRFYRPGETVEVKVRACDFNDQGLAVPVTLTISKQQKDNKYLALTTQNLTTDASGWTSYKFVPDENAYYTLEAKAKDSRQRDVTASYYCWVADHGWRSPVSYSGINLDIEKNTYASGETARILLTTGYADSWALFSVENHKIISYRLIKLNGGAYTFDEAITEKMQPFATVRVTMLEGENLVQAQKNIVVPPIQKFLNISIATDKPQYKPGEQANYTIKVTDWKDQPVVAEFSFGLVDEAIYAIRSESTVDIRKAFHQTSRGQVQTTSSFQFRSQGYSGGEDAKKEVANKQSSREAAAPAEEEADDRSEQRQLGKNQQTLVEPKMRSEFRDSGVWQPTVVTDAQGMAKISFTMPDNLTTWRATVRAVTIKGKAGQFLHKIITRKNLMARLECPRTVTERDELIISGVIHNYLPGDKDCVCRLKVEGAQLLSTSEQKIQLKSGEDKRVDWKIKVDSIHKLKLELYALTNEESDAMSLELPIVVHGAKIRDANSGVADAETNITLALPSSVIKERSQLVVRVKPTLAGAMLESLEYLAGYPYGCVEQTMSRFLPSVIVASTLQKLQLRNAKLEENLPKYVAQGTERLYNFQHSDGGWGWWENDQTNPSMTAYVVYGLSIARNADFDIRDDVINRGVSALENMIAQEKDPRTRNYLVFCYSQVRAPKKEWLDQLFRETDEMDDYSRAVLLLILNKNKDSRAQEMLKMLEKNAQVSGGYCHFSGKTRRYGWTDNPVETTAYCLKAIVNINPKHPLIPKILQWLEIRKKGDHYHSTKDTAAVVFAFADYLAHSDELNPEYDGKVIINGKPYDFSFHGEKANTAMQEFVVSPNTGDNSITIQKQGRGKVYFTTYLDYYSTEENLPAKGSGITVQREYFQLTPQKKEDGSIDYVRSALPDEIAQGTVFEVVLTLSGAENYEYVMLEDYIPAGCEFEKQEDERDRKNYYYYGWSNREERDDRLVVFFGYYSQGSRKISYKLRAETPGTFHAMPASASLMYFPEISGSSSERILTIQEKD